MRLIIRMLSIAGLLLTVLGLYLTISGAINISHGDFGAIVGTVLGVVVLVASGLLLLASGLLAAANAVRRGTRRWWIGILATLFGGVVAPGVYDQLTHGSPLPNTGGSLPGYLPYLVGMLLPSLATLAYSFTGGGGESGSSGSHRPALAGLSGVTLVLLGLTGIGTLIGGNMMASLGSDATFVLVLVGVALGVVVAVTLALLALRNRRFKWFTGLVPVTILSLLLVLIFTPLGSALNLPGISQLANGTTAVILAILVPIATLISSLFSHRWPQTESE
jgi:hypothetical protein